MSRASVRDAVVNWFSPPNVAGLNLVTRSKTKLVQGQEFFASTGAGSGAVAFIYFEGKREHRRSIGGPKSGWKRAVYKVGLVVLFRSNKPKMEDASDDHDALMDAIEARLRSDRTLGGAVFSAGEGAELGQDDIETVSDLPKLVGQETHIWGVLRFEVAEWIQS
jgi:hypothetical protein